MSISIPLGNDGKSVEIFHSELAETSCTDILDLLNDENVNAEVFIDVAVSIYWV